MESYVVLQYEQEAKNCSVLLLPTWHAPCPAPACAVRSSAFVRRFGLFATPTAVRRRTIRCQSPSRKSEFENALVSHGPIQICFTVLAAS